MTKELIMKILIAQNLKRLLYENDMTVAQLSRATKVPPQTLNNWLSGLEPRNLRQVKQIAEFFRLTLDDFVYGSVDKKISGSTIEDYKDEIFAGVFEVVLRKKK